MSQTTFSRGVSDSLKGVMQLGILFSHLSYTSAEPALIFTLANKLGTSIIALYFFISGYGLMQAIKSGKGVGKLSQRLLGDIQAHATDHPTILTLPNSRWRGV